MNQIIENEEIKKLKQELKYLEKKYQTLVVDRDSLLKDIEEFNVEYTLKFEDLLNKILALKEENVYKKIELRKLKKEKLLKDDKVLENLQTKKEDIKAQIDKIKLEIKLNGATDELLFKKQELEIALKEVVSQIDFIEEEKEKFEAELYAKTDEDLEMEFEDIKDEKEEFKEDIKTSQEIQKLNKTEKQELKKFYRQLSKLIHPDVVDDEYKDEAQNLMSRLNELYRLNKLDEIKEFYLQIKNKSFIFVSDTLSDKEIIQNQIYQMKDKIVEILKEIDELKANEIFEVIENKDVYFNEIKEDLNKRIASLKNESSYLDINLMKYQEMK